MHWTRHYLRSQSAQVRKGTVKIVINPSSCLKAVFGTWVRNGPNSASTSSCRMKSRSTASALLLSEYSPWLQRHKHLRLVMTLIQTGECTQTNKQKMDRQMDVRTDATKCSISLLRYLLKVHGQLKIAGLTVRLLKHIEKEQYTSIRYYQGPGRGGMIFPIFQFRKTIIRPSRALLDELLFQYPSILISTNPISQYPYFTDWYPNIPVSVTNIHPFLVISQYPDLVYRGPNDV